MSRGGSGRSNNNDKSSAWMTLLKFQVPKTVALDPKKHKGDSRQYAMAMGMTNRAIQIAIFIMFIMLIMGSNTHQRKEAVTGSVSFYVGAAAMYDAQGEVGGILSGASSGNHFCQDTKPYWYHNGACDQADELAAKSSSCEYDITCSLPEYAEATKKGETEVLVYTYLKDTSYKVFPCDYKMQNTCNADEKFQEKTGHPTCKCWKVSNQFLIGVEDMTLSIKHEFDQPKTLAYKFKDEQRYAAGIKTTVVSKSIDGEKLKVFEPGESIKASVGQWLKWAGVNDLNEVNEKALSDYPPTRDIAGSNQKPVYRMTGLEINLELYWTGNVGEYTVAGGSSVECFIIVHTKEGYHSFGSAPLYVDYGDISMAKGMATATDRHLHDRYMRGIKFKFSTAGTIGEFFFIDFVLSCAAFFVYFAMAPTITSGLFDTFARGKSQNAFRNYVGHEHKTWKDKRSENIDLDAVHMQRMMATMLSTLVLPRVLSFAELCNMLAEAQPASANPEHPKIGQDDALRMTEWMMKAAHPGTKNPREETLSADQFAKLLHGGGRDLPSLTDVISHMSVEQAAKMTSRSSSQIEPADYP